jgi:phospholipid/cholesterol/gamma-HCH transport system ATP-binding protein
MIRFDNVIKKFGHRLVLDRFNLHVKKGETMVLVGTSGAGKSVTLKHMVKLLKPTQGEVLIAGEAISATVGKDLQRLRGDFGFLFQSSALLQWMSVGENIALPLREHTLLSDEEIEEKVRAVLAQVGLEEAIWKLPEEISGGMKKRAGLARAIVTEPKIILYDEPTSGLDPVTSRTIDELIMHLKRDLGVTSVVVTHDMISALTVGDRIAMLHQGRVVEVSTPAEFLQSKHPEVRDFLDAQYISSDFLKQRSSHETTP